MNRVEFLLSTPFSSLSKKDQLAIIKLGPYQPKDFHFSQEIGPGTQKRRNFNPRWFRVYRWLTVNTTTNKLHCYNCLLFCKLHSTWSNPKGFSSLKHLSEAATLHCKSINHLNSSLRLATFESDMVAKFDSASHILRPSTLKHNEAVSCNRHILDKIIEGIKFCGFHELAICGDDDIGNSLQSVFTDSLTYMSTGDALFCSHLETETMKRYMSAEINNELLDCIYGVYIDNLKELLGKANYVTMEVDEITHKLGRYQFVIILRFINGFQPEERLLKIVDIDNRTGPVLAKVILEELAPYNLKDKLIAQSYDVASVTGGTHKGVEKFVQEDYPHAQLIHSNAHQTNYLLQIWSNDIPDVKLFFAAVSSFSDFFSSSRKRSDALSQACIEDLPSACELGWNYNSCILNFMSRYKDIILSYLYEIQESYEWDQKTMFEALALSKTLEDAKFNYFLDFFKNVSTQTDILLRRFQTGTKIGQDIEQAFDNFNSAIFALGERLPKFEFEESEHSAKRRRMISPLASAYDVCDVITSQLTNRLKSSGFFEAFTLVDPVNFISFKKESTDLTDIVTAIPEKYGFMDKYSLLRELEVLYSNEIFQSKSVSSMGMVKFYEFLLHLELGDTFQEVKKLLEIALVTPVHTDEPERQFTTLKRIQSFVRNDTSKVKLNALAVLSVHRDFIKRDLTFNSKVIDKYAFLANRGAEFVYQDTL